MGDKLHGRQNGTTKEDSPPISLENAAEFSR